ncbi:hypothetical protein OJF2_51200 [Aquisphaera giovannonii]|uniref:Uncharacterized protein n=1 Tax=Aquisphaera giovannonii TaxID=406548 RepID=A0A5B9W786_9BACT|nr:hypothetical protein [Aquisphaera giovannonii]QEH36536.1 hypothetical protein OJF2_51200 [Aquisphaera giovannonii]
MTAERDELLTELRTIWAEQHPGRPPKADFSDEVIAATTYLSRKIEKALKTRVIEPAFAEGFERQPTARKRGRAELAE